MNLQPPVHPLSQTFTYIHQLNQYIGARLGTPTELAWVTPAELLALASPHLATLISATQKRLHTTAVNTVGGALIQEYQWPLISTAVACFLVDRRVPDLQPAQVCLHLPTEEHGEGEEADHTHIAYTSGRFAALPADPAADHPDATIVPDEDALRNDLRTGLETHFAWVIERLSAATGCHQRGLWLYVSDRIAGTLAWLMQMQNGQSCLACIDREADRLLRVTGSPLYHKKIGFFELTYKERTHVYLDRTTCCYWYKTDGGDYCSTCPHRTKEDRNGCLLKHLAKE